MKNFVYCEKFRKNLIANLKKRLGWLEKKDLYIHATVLTPKYGLIWLNSDERENFDKYPLIRAIENFVIKHPVKQSSNVTTNKDLTHDSIRNEPPTKKPKLMSFLDDDDDYLASMTTRRSVSKQIGIKISNKI